MISAPESESGGLECFHFLRLRLRSAYDLVKTRLSESEAEAEGQTNPDTSFLAQRYSQDLTKELIKASERIAK